MFATRFSRKPRKGLTFKSPSLTEQRFRNDTDINVMIQRALSGDPSAIRAGRFLDISALPESSQDFANIIARGKTVWHDLPSNLKAAYGSVEAFLRALEISPSASPTDGSKPSPMPENCQSVKTDGSTPSPVLSNT